jgi:hypothetical protein
MIKPLETNYQGFHLKKPINLSFGLIVTSEVLEQKLGQTVHSTVS